jgi:hypothetical protein
MPEINFSIVAIGSSIKQKNDYIAESRQRKSNESKWDELKMYQSADNGIQSKGSGVFVKGVGSLYQIYREIFGFSRLDKSKTPDPFENVEPAPLQSFL